MPVRIVFALLARSLMDSRALRPERNFVHEITSRTTNKTQREFGGSRSSLEETLSKKRSARASKEAQQVTGKAASTTPDTTMHLRLLPELTAKKYGGRCMDGTQAGYYYGGPSSGESTTWVFYMNGGGGCSDVDACAGWMYTEVGPNQADKGSSGWQGDEPVKQPKVWSETYSGGTSFLNSDPEVNPGFHDAHHVRIPYCTGDSHGGQIGDPEDEAHGGLYVHEEEGPLYLDGHLNLKRILRDLGERVPAFANMQHVLLFGGSAGGMGVFTNCDFLRRKLPASVVKCAPESGLFSPAYWANTPNDVADPDERPVPWDFWIAGQPSPVPVVLYGNPYIPPECDREDWECASAGMKYKYIVAPVYFRQDEFDSALIGGLGLQGNDRNSVAGETYMSLIGKATRETVKQHKDGDGAYLTSCLAHGGHSATVNGGSVTYEQSLADWFWHDIEKRDPLFPHVLIDDCTEVEGFACNPDCDADPCQIEFNTLCVDWVPDCIGCAQVNLDALTAAGCNQAGIINAIGSMVGCAR